MGQQPGVGADAPVIVLVDATTTVERGLVEDWMRAAGLRPFVVRPLRATALVGPLAEADDATEVVPVRVVWRPRERDGGRRVHWTDMLSLTSPRRPAARAQARIVRREPDRVSVAVA